MRVISIEMTRPKSAGFLAGILLLLAILLDKPVSLEAQRSLHHWKRDLEHQMRIYEEHHNSIRNIIASSIYTRRGDVQLGAPEVRVSADGNVRFSDLIIPAGALRLSSHIAEPTVHILVNKTKSYVDSKANELSHIQNQLDTIVHQLHDPRQQYIYKGLRGAPQPQNNFTHVITGTRVFKQAQYVQLVEARNVTVPRINLTDVSRVIDDTYLRNTKLGVYDSQNRLFFEGRKTFWNTVFSKPLKSGCCDRLMPLHTNRMMLRSLVQEVMAPILIYSRDSARQPQWGAPAIIRHLSTNQLYNRPIELTPQPPSRPDQLGLLAPTQPPSNHIHLTNLVNIRLLGQPEIIKRLVFQSPVMIEEALLSNSFVDNRLTIGFANMPQFAFDVAHDNYLLKFSTLPANVSQPIQQVTGTIVLDAEAHFLAGLLAPTVNRLNDFARFVRESIVYVTRAAVIRGPVQFDALPRMLNPMPAGASRRPQNVLIMRATQNLEVGLVNGMRVPQDLVLLPGLGQMAPVNQPQLRAGELIRVNGPRHFANRLFCRQSLNVSGLVNGLELPAGVIPLHLNDFMGSVGHSNLWFMDGISLQHLTIQGGHFDEINLTDVNGGAQSIILNSMSTRQPDGSTLIRAPLRVINLHLLNSPGLHSTGQLNGFRPQEVLELNPRQPFEMLYGRKQFLAPVEVSECIFNDINQVANWTNHLIRIDRPNTVQTVHTKLLFSANQPPADSKSAQLNIDRLSVEFERETEPAHYRQNWDFSPEFYLLHQALMRNKANYTGGRYRVLERLQLIHPSGGLVNGIPLADVVRLDQPFAFADTFTMVGKVDVLGALGADRIQSNYPLDSLDLVQFGKYRIPIQGNGGAPIRLNSLTLAGQANRASFVQSRLLNGISLSDFVQSIMSITRPQRVASSLVFRAPTSFEGMLRTASSVNGLKAFHNFAQRLREAKYSFEDGLQCNSVLIKT